MKRFNGKKMSHGKKNLNRPVKVARAKPVSKKAKK